QARIPQLADLIDIDIDVRPSKTHTAPSGGPLARNDSLANDRPLQLSNGTQNREYHFSGRCGCINGLPQAHKVDTHALKFLQCSEQMAGGPRQPIKSPTDDNVELAASRVGH